MAEEIEIISTYTRADALEDGVLVNVTKTAKEAGFIVPVAVTRDLWDSWIKPPENMERYGQSTSGRLWDVLWQLKIAAGITPGAYIEYAVIFLTPARVAKAACKQEIVKLVSKIGPGDQGEPVITIMLPDNNNVTGGRLRNDRHEPSNIQA